MAKCRDCDAFVVFLKRPDDSFLPPFDPIATDDVDLGDVYISNDAGQAARAPMLFRKHRCVSAEEKVRIHQEREAERQRLIQEDRERRRVAREAEEALEARRMEEERLEAEARREFEEAATADLLAETKRPKLTLVSRGSKDWEDVTVDPDWSVKQMLDHRRKVLRQRFQREWQMAVHYQFRLHSERLKAYACRGCGAQADQPCWASKQPSELEILGRDLALALGQITEKRLGRMYSDPDEPKWLADRPCSERWADAPALPRPARRPAFNEKDCREWPPPPEYHSGRADMAEFLMQNVDLFNIGSDASPDTYRKPRRFLTGLEVEQMGGWLRENAPILWEEASTNLVSVEAFERWMDDGGRVPGGLDEASGEDRGPAQAGGM